MHIIGFSHHYTKLHNQTFGTLLSVSKTIIGPSFPMEGRDYDTEYILENTTGPGRIPCYDWYHFPNGSYLQLVFIGNKQIPFTTYRKIPDNYKPWKNRSPRTYRKTLPYSDLIGQHFAFKFKGASLPKSLLWRISAKKGGCVRIFD